MKNKNKKAFTLIELLAIIVLLALILIISVPKVVNTIEESDKESFRISAEHLVKEATDKVVKESLDISMGKVYTITDGAFVGDSIQMTGKLPDNGVINITSEGIVSIAVSNDKWCATKYEDEENVYVSKDPDCQLYIPEAVAESCFTRTNDGVQVTITDYDNLCSKNVIIPDTLDGFPVRIINNYSFSSNSLTSVSIPNSVTNINYGAFRSNMLSKVIIPNTHITYGYTAFNWNNLPANQAFIYAKNLDGSDDLTKIVSYGGIERDNVVIPDGVQYLEVRSFSYNDIINVVIPNSVIDIADYAFVGNSFIDVVIPEGVTNIGEGAFGWCWDYIASDDSINSITLPGSLRTIGDYAFIYNKVSTLTIPNGVTSIGAYAFEHSPLTSLSIPNTVTFIGASAFTNCLLPDEEAFIFARNPDGSENTSRLVSYCGAKKKILSFQMVLK